MLYIILLSLFFFFFNLNSYAFNTLIHEQIIKSTFQYVDLKDAQLPIFEQWLYSKKDEIETILARAAVDVDYQADLWMGAWYLPSFAGSKTDTFGMLTSLYHFTNVTKPGEYWDYDGYANKNTDGRGNDSYLGMWGMKIRGDLSFPLGGEISNEAQKSAMVYLGDYKLGFKGSDIQWKDLYFDAYMADAVLPPSYVPAQKAYELFIFSDNAKENKIEEWEAQLPIVEYYIFKKNINYTFMRQELEGFPEHLDKLGITIHMIQDLAVPHHAQGIAGSCHTELEALTDRLACKEGSSCQELYNPVLVREILENKTIFNEDKLFSIPEFFVKFAKVSSKWKFGKFNKDKIATILPSNLKKVSGKDCSKILEKEEIYQQIEFQYNYAVAGTIFILQQSFLEWENNHKLVLKD